MRAYFFGNMYLSSIQQGIQAVHVTTEIMNGYIDGEDGKFEIFHNWALNHKTVILCNAGYSTEIRSLYEFFSERGNPYPFAMFNEESDALDGASTSVGIIVPEKIYDHKNWITANDDYGTPLTGRVALNAVFQSLNPKVQLVHSVFNQQNSTVQYTALTPYELALAERISRYALAR